jgi:hypothetical protein
MENSANSGEFAPGDFLFFKNNTVHAIPDLLEGRLSFSRSTRPGAIPGTSSSSIPKTELQRASSGIARHSGQATGFLKTDGTGGNGMPGT